MNNDPMRFVNRGDTLQVTTVATDEPGAPSTYTGEPRTNKRGEGYFLWKLSAEGQTHTYYVKPSLNELLDGQYSPGTPLTIRCQSDTEYEVTVQQGAAPVPAVTAPVALPAVAPAPAAAAALATTPLTPGQTEYHSLRADLRTCVEDVFYDWGAVFGDGLKPDPETIQKLAVTLFLQCCQRNVEIDHPIPF